jgi:hypothetical protein
MFETFDFVNWYFSLPFPAQIAVVAGGIAVAILGIILAVYIIKWTILAIIYLIKGMVNAIKWGVKKVTESLNAPCCAPATVQEKDPFAKKNPVAGPVPLPATTPAPAQEPVAVSSSDADKVPRFCANCGTPLAVNIQNRLITGQSAFCPQCGTSVTQDLQVQA